MSQNLSYHFYGNNIHLYFYVLFDIVIYLQVYLKFNVRKKKKLQVLFLS